MIEKSKINLGPGDIRGISDPPDMGKLRPAEDVARRLVVVSDRGAFLGAENSHIALLYGEKAAGPARNFLAGVIRQSRAEGAAAALEEAAARLADQVNNYEKCAADCWSDEGASSRYAGKAEAYGEIAALLRDRIKTISDPPDMG